MKYRLLPGVALLLAAAANAEAEQARNACMEGPIAQFGRYIGDWQITDEALSRDDGVTWNPRQGARWTFECIGDGTAIQDHWRPSNGGYGTNLRTYNADTGMWEIAWAAKTQQGLMHITAKQADDGRIVMNVISPKPPQPRRIIFFPPEGDGWKWVMQWSQDDGETWFDVYRITATPWEG